jgi:hypothetical protein
MSIDSVISSVRHRGAIPASAIAAVTSPTRPSYWNWRAERLTFILSSVANGAARCHSANCAHAARSTHRPSGTIRPLSSALPMNSCGPSSPSRGCIHRTSASAPIRRCDAMSTTGW